MSFEHAQESKISCHEQLRHLTEMLPSILKDLLGPQRFSTDQHRDFKKGGFFWDCTVHIAQESVTKELCLAVIHKNPTTGKSEEIKIMFDDSETWINLQHHLFPLDEVHSHLSEKEQGLVNLLSTVTSKLKDLRNREQNAKAANIAHSIQAVQGGIRQDISIAQRNSNSIHYSQAAE